MKYLDPMRWSLWGGACHGLGSARGGTGGERAGSNTGDSRGSTSSSSRSSGGYNSSGFSSGRSSGGYNSSGFSSGRSSGEYGGGRSSSSSSSSSRGSSGRSSSSGGYSSGGSSRGSSSSSRGSSGSSGRSSERSNGGGYNSSGFSSGRSSGGYNGSIGRSTGGSGGLSSGNSRSGGTTGRSTGGTTGRTGGIGASNDVSTSPSGRGSYGGKATGTVGDGLSAPSSYSGSNKSNKADKGGRVTSSFDTGRFGDRTTTSYGKEGRVGSSSSRSSSRSGRGLAGAAGFAGSGPSPREAETRSMGALAQDRVSGAFSAGVATKGGRIGRGLTPEQDANLSSRLGGTPLSPAQDRNLEGRLSGQPAVSGRMAEESSMKALRDERSRHAVNYGQRTGPAARAAEDRSMGKLYDYDKEVVSAPRAGAGWTEVQLRDGTVETRKGTRASRNNNPGNIEYHAGQSAVGTDGRFGVYSTPAAGRKAMEGLVFGPNYAGKTILGAISKYAPKHENNTEAYAASVAAAAGVSPNTPLSALNPAQREAMIEGMTRVEGGRPYSTTTVAEGAPRGTPPSQRRGANGLFSETKTARAAPSSIPTPTAAPRGTRMASSAPVTPEVRQAAQRRGVDPQAVADYASSYAMSPEDAAFAITPQNQLPGYKDAGFVPSRTVASAPRDVPTIRTASVQPAVAKPAQQAAQRFEAKYLGNVPTPTARPTAQAARPSAPAERPMADKILSGAIDVGVGMLPGVGMAAGLYSAAAPMVGLPTIGDMALNLRDTNQYDLNVDAARRSAKQSGGDLHLAQPEPVPEQVQFMAPPQITEPKPTFKTKYLDEGIKRPTPTQKWGGIGGGTVPYTL